MVLTSITILAVVMDIRVYFVVINATGIIKMTLPTQVNGINLPLLLQTHRGSDTLIIFQGVGRVGFGI